MIDLSRAVVDNWNIGNHDPTPTSWRVHISADQQLSRKDYDAANAVVGKRVREDPAWRPHHVKVRVLDDGVVEIVE